MKKCIMLMVAVILTATTVLAQTEAPRRVKSVTSKYGTSKPVKTNFFYNEDGSLARIESHHPADRYSAAMTFVYTYSLSGNEFTFTTSGADVEEVKKWSIDAAEGTLTYNYKKWDGASGKDLVKIADHEITANYITDAVSPRLQLWRSYKYDADGNLISFTEGDMPGTATAGRKLYKCPSVDVLSYIVASLTSIYDECFIDWVNHAPDGLSLRPMTNLPSKIKTSTSTYTFTLWTLDAQGYIQSVKIKELNEVDDTPSTIYYTYTVEYEN